MVATIVEDLRRNERSLPMRCRYRTNSRIPPAVSISLAKRMARNLRRVLLPPTVAKSADGQLVSLPTTRHRPSTLVSSLSLPSLDFFCIFVFSLPPSNDQNCLKRISDNDNGNEIISGERFTPLTYSEVCVIYIFRHWILKVSALKRAAATFSFTRFFLNRLHFFRRAE